MPREQKRKNQVGVECGTSSNDAACMSGRKRLASEFLDFLAVLCMHYAAKGEEFTFKILRRE